jgi:hypothetical protein
LETSSSCPAINAEPAEATDKDTEAEEDTEVEADTEAEGDTEAETATDVESDTDESDVACIDTNEFDTDNYQTPTPTAMDVHESETSVDDSEHQSQASIPVAEYTTHRASSEDVNLQDYSESEDQAVDVEQNLYLDEDIESEEDIHTEEGAGYASQALYEDAFFDSDLEEPYKADAPFD